MSSDLGDSFKKIIEFRDAKASLLKKYNDKFDFDELSKLAIDYSDGVIAGCNNVDNNLLKYAADNNIPTLSYPGEDFQNAYEEFYDKI
jgi:starch synthase